MRDVKHRFYELPRQTSNFDSDCGSLISGVACATSRHLEPWDPGNEIEFFLGLIIYREGRAADWCAPREIPDRRV